MLSLALLLISQLPTEPAQIKVDPTVTTDLSQPLAGSVALKVRLDTDLTASRNRSLSVYVDGKNLGPPATYTGNGALGTFIFGWQVDTTTLADGPHVLRCVTYATATSGDLRNYMRASEVTNFSTDNKRACRDIRANFGTVYLDVGESVTITARAVASDGGEVALPATYTFDATGVATIDTTGKVTGLAAGETNVYSWIGSRYATTHVIVGPHTPIPSFGGKFSASVFGLSPQAMDADPALAAAVKTSGINTLEVQVYQNLADGSGTDTQAIAGNQATVTRALAAGDKYGMSLLGIGDDIARTAPEMAWSITSPTAAAILAETMPRLHGKMLGIEMIDEGTWGTDPFPTDGRWLARIPSTPDTAFVTLLARLGSDRPPINWPLAATAGSDAVGRWAAISDYLTLYPNVTAYAISDQGQALSVYYAASADKFKQFSPIVNGKPQLVLGWIGGQTYIKGDGDGEWTPGSDKLISPACGAQAVVLILWTAAMLGAAGSRLYTFDTGNMKRQRLNAVIGSRVATGADPLTVGTDRWQAMASALGLIHKLEPQLFGAPMHAPDLGDGIATAARGGANGRLLMALNTREAPETCRIDLAPYRGAGAVQRWILDPMGVYGPVDVAGAEDRVTLKGGQGLAYICLP